MAVRYRPTTVIYHYRIDPQWGWMHARIQTWFPFPIQICLNGREWLARQMGRADLAYVRQDNCFPWVEDWQAAQRLLDQQLRVAWPALLDELARVATQEPFIYSHAWRKDDVIMWDNRCTMHAVMPYDNKTVRRIMHRTTLVGEGPVLAA